jgi:hypothetical protein
MQEQQFLSGVHCFLHFFLPFLSNFFDFFIKIFSFCSFHYCLAAPLFSNKTAFSVDEMRQFMEHFAKKKLLDPLIAETWYTINGYRLHRFKVL